MSKFKIVKNRSQETETENDLRGLGQTTVFKDSHLKPFMFIKGEITEKTHHLCKQLNLNISDNKHGFHLFTSNTNQEQYKETTVDLFALGLHHSHEYGHFFTISHESGLHNNLLDGITGKKIQDHHSEYLNLWKNQKFDNLISVQTYFTLVQLGLKFNKSSHHLSLSEQDTVMHMSGQHFNHIHLEKNELNDLYLQFFKDQAIQAGNTQFRKVG